jgi:hypothetical protein
MALFEFLLSKLLIPILRRSWPSDPSQPEIFEPEISEKNVGSSGRLAACRDYYNIGMALAQF